MPQTRRVQNSPDPVRPFGDQIETGLQAERNATEELEEAWALCADLFDGWVAKQRPTITALESELVFCLLGGFGISYEHNRSAAEVLKAVKPLDPARSDAELRAILVEQFERQQFQPPRRDGQLRRYRFPLRKTELIVAARRWHHGRPQLHRELLSLQTGCERRALLCGCPGVGPKTASWILRNVGIGDDLAVIDVHLVRALRNAGRISDLRLPRDYGLAERAFLDWCRELDASPAAFDLFVWEWQRGDLQAA